MIHHVIPGLHVDHVRHSIYHCIHTYQYILQLYAGCTDRECLEQDALIQSVCLGTARG